MESLYIEGTKKTPAIHFKAEGQLTIKGRSIPEDPSKFYDILLNWIEHYCSYTTHPTTVNIDLEYFNSGTSKALLHLLRVLVDFKNKGNVVNIVWFYETGDDDIYERGEYYSTILETQFQFIEITQEQ
jgi:hypothetical protein